MKKQVNPNYFVGKVTLRELYNEPDSNDNEVYYVEFNDGALTTVHIHESQQILLPIYGKGIVGEIRGDFAKNHLNFDIKDINLKLLNVGETVAIPPNVLHFHGALPGYNFSHVAFRKIFAYDDKAENSGPYRTKTRWASDLLVDQFGDSDLTMISTKLEELSKKVQMSISNHTSD